MTTSSTWCRSRFTAGAGALARDEWPKALATFLSSKITRRAYRRHLEAFAAWCKADGVLTPGELSPGLLGRYRAELLAGDAGVATRKQAIGAIRSFLGWARPSRPTCPAQASCARCSPFHARVPRGSSQARWHGDLGAV